MPDWMLSAIVAGAFGALGSFVAVRVQVAEIRRDVSWLSDLLKETRRDISAAHRRLDTHGVPAAHHEGQ